MFTPTQHGHSVLDGDTHITDGVMEVTGVVTTAATGGILDTLGDTATQVIGEDGDTQVTGDLVTTLTILTTTEEEDLQLTTEDVTTLIIEDMHRIEITFQTEAFLTEVTPLTETVTPPTEITPTDLTAFLTTEEVL